MVYDSYNAKAASATINNVMIENTSNTYSITNELKCDVDNVDENISYKRNVLLGAVTAVPQPPSTNYSNNHNFQELPTKKRLIF